MIFLILKSHGSLHFSGSIDELPQWISGKRMIVAAGIDVFKLACLVITPFRIRALKEKAFNFIGSIQRVSMLLVHFICEGMQNAADVGCIRRPIFVDEFAKHEDLARPEDIGGRPVEGSPINAKAQIACTRRGKTANGGSVERQVIPTLDQELLIVVEHM